jgi:hypothetical protein
VLLAECPWKGKRLQIVAEGEGGYTLATPQGNYWYRRDCVELFDEAIEAIADARSLSLSVRIVYILLSARLLVDLKWKLRSLPRDAYKGNSSEIPANPLAPIQVEFEDGTSKEFYRSQIEIAGVIGKGDMWKLLAIAILSTWVRWVL